MQLIDGRRQMPDAICSQRRIGRLGYGFGLELRERDYYAVCLSLSLCNVVSMNSFVILLEVIPCSSVTA